MGWMAANLSGTLQGAQATATTACAWVELGDGRRVDVSWPQGFTARMTSPGHLELLSPQGAVVVRTGDQLEIGGGFRRGTTSWCISGDGGPFQAGPITANGVHAYGWPDTDTATATTENPGSTIVLPTNEYVPGLLWPTAARHGTLTARTEGTQTCLYLVQSGGTPVDLSWPAGFAARSADTIEVLAPDGQVVARVGDQLAVGGGGGGPATACAAAGNSFNIGPIDTNGTQTYPSPEAPA
jgi:hypothetical protein